MVVISNPWRKRWVLMGEPERKVLLKGRRT